MAPGEKEDKLFKLCEKFEQHVVRFEQHEQEESDKFNKLITAQQVNTEAISSLTDSVSSLVQDTSEVIQLHKDIQGAARVGKSVQGFMIWCLKWGAIGTGVATAVHLVIDHFKN